MATEWKSQQSAGDYRLQFQTDDKEKYKLVEKAAQMAVDGNHTADIVEVVRCCTCKYSEAVGDIGCHCQNRKTPWFNDEFEVYMNLDDFCSYGERKEK